MTKLYFLADFNLNEPLETLTGLEDYGSVRGLVLLGGEALGEVELPVKGGQCCGDEQRAAIAQRFTDEILLRSLTHSLAAGPWNPDIGWPELLAQQNRRTQPQACAVAPAASLTVAICWATAQSPVTPAQVAACLDRLSASLKLLPGAPVEVIAVGPAAAEGELRVASAQTGPDPLALQYLADDSNDLTEQRRRVLANSQGDVIAFMSPQVQVGLGWAAAIAQRFQEDASVCAMTGPLLPNQETTEAWEILNGQGIASPSYDRWWYRQSSVPSEQWQQVYFHHPIPEQNVAFRRLALVEAPASASALSNSYQLTFQQMSQGYSLCNDPAMVARESQDQTPEQLALQARAEAERLGCYFAWGWMTPSGIPQGYRALFLNEALGGLRWYGQSSLQQEGLAKQFFQAKLAGFSAGLQTGLKADIPTATKHLLQGLGTAVFQRTARERRAQAGQRLASRSLDLSQPLPAWTDLQDYDGVRIFLTQAGDRKKVLLGHVNLWHRRGSIPALQISHNIVRWLGDRLFTQAAQGHTQAKQNLARAVAHWLQPHRETAPATAAAVPDQLPLSVPVSVIITTCDRPDDLRNCLHHLLSQTSDRDLEIIVADNRPASGVTPRVIQEFPGVKLVSEPRVGGSYGRNSAFCASRGDIVITVDDDVTVPPDWLETLLAPMARPEVLAVTGNVLPRELETEAQRMYEDLYGGLGEGLDKFEVNGQWLSSFSYSPPVWDLGVSANSAFRASIFHHPNIGMMPEELGPGTPVGGGEENYLIYRILRAGGTLVYEPAAYAWHRHRRTVPELRYQIYRQMMGGTAYHLRLWRIDQDLRAKQQLLSGLPRYFAGRFVERAKGQNQVPWRFLWAEFSGYLAGFWGYRQSLKAVERQGMSQPYVPVCDRPQASSEPAVSSAPSLQASLLENLS